MSLTAHLAFVKRSWLEAIALCVRDPDMWVWGGMGGGRNAFGALEGEQLWICHSRDIRKWAVSPGSYPRDLWLDNGNKV